MPIDSGLSVNQLIQRHPSVLPVLTEAGVDTCCGGALSLEEAASRAGVDLVNLVGRLETQTAVRSSAPPEGDAPSCSCGCGHN